jgi:alpha-beta hydrolase superfamily lysophospholipase
MDQVTYRDGTWTEPASGRTLFYRMWRPTAPKLLLVILHGFAEHGGRYRALAEQLAARGLCVAIPDLWGHGRSRGPRGDLGELADTVRNVEDLTQRIFLEGLGTSQYAVFGHSFGGMLAIAWALQSPGAFDRLVVQSPLIDVAFPVPGWKTSLASWLAFWWPGFQFTLDLNAAWLCHDDEEVRAYTTDSLVHNAMSAGTYRSITRWQQQIRTRPADVQASTLLLCGSDDRVVSVAAALRWFEGLTAPKRSMVFPGCFHELHHEPVCADVAALAVGWVLTPEVPGQGAG